jgi:predicted CXXCH cytochrome family protein
MICKQNDSFSRFDIVAVFLLLLAAMSAWAVEHPGVVPKDAECSSCHEAKITGRSVHSAMAIACTVCHLAKTQGDMTIVNLVMPKAQICFACHEKSTELLQHSTPLKGQCVDCHDAHSSDRRMLLLRDAPGARGRP